VDVEGGGILSLIKKKYSLTFIRKGEEKDSLMGEMEKGVRKVFSFIG